jgi:hypothetical protein
MEGSSVRLYEKRQDDTRTRMVQLAPYLVADSSETYRTDPIDGDSLAAIFDPPELDEGLAFSRILYYTRPTAPKRSTGLIASLTMSRG